MIDPGAGKKALADLSFMEIVTIHDHIDHFYSGEPETGVYRRRNYPS